MSSSPPPQDQEARTQHHLACLDTLIAQGMDLATRLHQQSTTPSALCSALAKPGIAIPVTTEETVILFTHLSRAIRRTILLSRKLAEPLPLAPAKPAPGRPDFADRNRSHRQDGPDTLGAERHERVETGDLDDYIGHRPVEDIIAELSRDLATAEDWNAGRATPQALQTLIAEPSSPAEPTATKPRANATAPNGSRKPELRPPKL